MPRGILMPVVCSLLFEKSYSYKGGNSLCSSLVSTDTETKLETVMVRARERGRKGEGALPESLTHSPLLASSVSAFDPSPFLKTV